MLLRPGPSLRKAVRPRRPESLVGSPDRPAEDSESESGEGSSARLWRTEMFLKMGRGSVRKLNKSIHLLTNKLLVYPPIDLVLKRELIDRFKKLKRKCDLESLTEKSQALSRQQVTGRVKPAVFLVRLFLKAS